MYKFEPMRTIIIDDDTTATICLVEKLKKYNEIEVCGTATTGEIGMKLVREVRPDLLFLDVELPDYSGVEFLEHINDLISQNCHVVMYTAFSHYMLPSFRNRAYDYLMKPIDDEELDLIIGRVLSASQNDGKETAENILPKEQNGKLLFYTNMVDFRVVHIKDIGLFQYNHEQRIWEVVIAGMQQPLRLKRNTNNDNLLTLDSRFVQVSQRFIININYLMEVSDNICRLFPPFDKIDYIKTGRLYRKRLIERFNSL